MFFSSVILITCSVTVFWQRLLSCITMSYSPAFVSLLAQWSWAIIAYAYLWYMLTTTTLTCHSNNLWEWHGTYLHWTLTYMENWVHDWFLSRNKLLQILMCWKPERACSETVCEEINDRYEPCEQEIHMKYLIYSTTFSAQHKVNTLAQY